MREGRGRTGLPVALVVALNCSTHDIAVSAYMACPVDALWMHYCAGSPVDALLEVVLWTEARPCGMTRTRACVCVWLSSPASLVPSSSSTTCGREATTSCSSGWRPSPRHTILGLPLSTSACSTVGRSSASWHRATAAVAEALSLGAVPVFETYVATPDEVRAFARFQTPPLAARSNAADVGPASTIDTPVLTRDGRRTRRWCITAPACCAT